MAARKTGPDARTVSLARERAGGLCERCGFAECQQIHHRRPRGMGGTRDKSINLLSNLFYVCFPCHRWIEENRTESLELGYLIRKLDPTPATGIPVKYRGVFKTLDNHGGMTR
ncbi:HNH endonuclease [Gordonia phage Dardanus]|uniref:HNH endonuclease n=1 Tax=Gordonia phage Dardanus TaxID=2588489 RepID=A0A514CX41_9CAUD|nr:HNH endonuclease [Gordonia phage Dardanus]QDH85083.1 HNH endonuclease [Gordonia phage Dardanus]